MNIFILDKRPQYAALYHCDKHVCKMIVETAQLFSCVLQNRGAEDERFYKVTHEHSPCVKWLDTHHGAFAWTLVLYDSLLQEYTNRYHKIHATEKRLPVQFFFEQLDKVASEGDAETVRYYFYKFYYEQDVTHLIAPPPRCMPEDCKCETIPGWDGAVGAYRWYYIQYKNYFARWRHGEKPEWFK